MPNWLQSIWNTILRVLGIGGRKFPSFETNPAKWLGFGVDDNWLWLDPDKFGDAMVDAGVNCTSIGLLGCNRTSDKVQTPPWGYWDDHWDELVPKLTKFLDAMKSRRIFVVVTITGWEVVAAGAGVVDV